MVLLVVRAGFGWMDGRILRKGFWVMRISTTTHTPFQRKENDHHSLLRVAKSFGLVRPSPSPTLLEIRDHTLCSKSFVSLWLPLISPPIVFQCLKSNLNNLLFCLLFFSRDLRFRPATTIRVRRSGLFLGLLIFLFFFGLSFLSFWDFHSLNGLDQNEFVQNAKFRNPNSSGVHFQRIQCVKTKPRKIRLEFPPRVVSE